MRSVTPKRSRKLTQPKRRREQTISKFRLEAQRKALLKRMDRLHPKITANQGYRSARALLTSKYGKAVGLAARLAVLQAAHFMISVLEMMPHV